MRQFLIQCGILGCLVTCLGIAGCSSFNGKRSFLSGQHEPKVTEEPDRWAIVGKEGRGGRPLNDEHDPLKPFLMSKDAQDIERNLGYK